MAEGAPQIELINVDVTGAELRSNTIMIQNVTWTIEQGNYWVIGGLPGTGKTDLLTTAAGLQRPASGTHLVFGRDLYRLDEGEQLRERLRVGLVFQNGGRLFAGQSILENLALPLCFHRDCTLEEARPRAQAILELTELGGMEKRLPHRLTRSFQQRVAMARALMLDPEVLLLDNPLLGIDARQAFWWLDFLPRLAAGVPQLSNRKMSLVVTTDDFRPWLSQGNHFALVNAKKWSIIGGRDDLEKTSDPVAREVLAPSYSRKET
jgi:ABC-type transporter Mla maintaining outer membrane lipid asymmetry ATPase subunit MlaF